MAQNASAIMRYTVTVADNFSDLSVQACFSGSPNDPSLSKLHASREARSAISNISWNKQTLRSVRSLKSSQFRRIKNKGCLRYQVELNDTSDRWGYNTSNYTLTKPEHWLLSPPEGSHAMIRFEHPPGIGVSHPWPAAQTSDTTDNWFRLASTSPSWSANVAFGLFKVQRIPIANTYLRLAVLPSRPAVNPDVTRQWVTESARAVLSSHGDLPQPEPQILIVPVGRQSKPIVFGRVLRGGGIGLQFFVDQHRTLNEYRDDWIPTHEFSHLLLPYISREDAWLSEGLASYYQNVMRSRDQRLNESDAWTKLLEGFERGRKGTSPNRTLAEEASGMHQNRAYHRVYWSGAAMMLIADARLREQTNGQQSLDTALAGLSECCMQLGKVWYGHDIMSRLDKITDTKVFTNTYRRYTRSNKFPNVIPTLNRLGVHERRNGVRLDDDAKFAHLRQQIMR